MEGKKTMIEGWDLLRHILLAHISFHSSKMEKWRESRGDPIKTRGPKKP